MSQGINSLGIYIFQSDALSESSYIKLYMLEITKNNKSSLYVSNDNCPYIIAAGYYPYNPGTDICTVCWAYWTDETYRFTVYKCNSGELYAISLTSGDCIRILYAD